MVRETVPQATSFGRTQIVSQLGETIDQTVQAIIVPANARGILPSSGARSLRSVAGQEIESETMRLAPLQLGSAVVTGSGRLADRNIEKIIHAVVSEEPGGARTLPVVRRALSSALELAYRERLSSIAVPLLTGNHLESPEELRDWIGGVVSEVVSHVRRDRVRLDSVVIVSRYTEDIENLSKAIAEARGEAWPP
ncbi:MAG: macro domain-containing protein [Thermomicrobiales bacterium]